MEPQFTVNHHLGEMTAVQLMQCISQVNPELARKINGGKNYSSSSGAGTAAGSGAADRNNRASCEWNQPYCDKLKQLTDKCKGNSKKENLYFSLERGRRSIMQCPHELRSRKDFLAVKNIGPFIARELEDVLNEMTGVKSAVQGAPNPKGRKKKTEADQFEEEPKPKRAKKAKVNASASQEIPNEDEDEDAVIVLPRSLSLQPPKTQFANSAVGGGLPRSVSMLPGVGSSTSQQLRKPVDEPKLVKSATNEGLSRSGSLLLPRTNSLATAAMPQQTNANPTDVHGIAASLQRLAEPSIDVYENGAQVVLLLDSREIGSMRERHFFENALRQLGCNVEVRGLPLGDVMWIIRTNSGQEFVCDTIIERKTISDLGTSIKDGRYKEQKCRLTDVSMSRMIYLVEGDVSKCTEVPISSIQSAILETRLSGFLLQHTANRDATCEFLLRVHNSILGKFKRKDFGLTQSKTWPVFNEKARSQLMETVGDIFRSQLVQIPGCSSERAFAITNFYPTPQALARAYLNPMNQLPDPEQEWKRQCKLLEDIEVGLTRRRIGPKLSLTIAQLYCTKDYLGYFGGDDEGDDDAADYEEYE